MRSSIEQGSDLNKMWQEESIGSGARGADNRRLGRPVKPKRALKQVMDLTLVFIFLPVWGPVMISLGLILKLSDGGPIFFAPGSWDRRGALGPSN